MTFLLDTDTCSAFLREHRKVVSKVLHFSGRIHVSAVTVGELFTWVHRARGASTRMAAVRQFFAGVVIHPIDMEVAEKFGKLRAELLDRGRVIGEMDLLNAAVALVHQLIVVTHNTVDYADVPGLDIEDWVT